jgi:hypothetical protein
MALDAVWAPAWACWTSIAGSATWSGASFGHSTAAAQPTQLALSPAAVRGRIPSLGRSPSLAFLVCAAWTVQDSVGHAATGQIATNTHSPLTAPCVAFGSGRRVLPPATVHARLHTGRHLATHRGLEHTAQQAAQRATATASLRSSQGLIQRRQVKNGFYLESMIDLWGSVKMICNYVSFGRQPSGVADIPVVPGITNGFFNLVGF